MRGLPYSTWGHPGKPALVFLHGFLGSRQDWEPIARELSQDYFCIACDLPGHGDASEDAASFDGTADALADLVRELGLASCTPVGYSMGARVALYFATRYPELCRSLVLESGSPGLETETERADRRGADEAHARELTSGNFPEFLRRWYAQDLFSTLVKDPARLDATLQRCLKNDPAGLARSLQGMGTGMQPTLWSNLTELTFPICLITGELDPKFVGIARRMTPLCKRSQMAMVPRTGHNVHLESPSAYIEIVAGFLPKT